jgi:hypothetical protein
VQLSGVIYASAVGFLVPHTTIIVVVGVLALTVTPLAWNPSYWQALTPGKSREVHLDVAFAAGIEDMKIKPERAGGLFQLPPMPSFSRTHSLGEGFDCWIQLPWFHDPVRRQNQRRDRCGFPLWSACCAVCCNSCRAASKT